MEHKAESAGIAAVIRDATSADLPAINDIYNWYVENSTSTWQAEKDTLEARRAWFEEHRARLPVLVAEDRGDTLAWASLSQFRPRAGYRYTLEDSVYVRHDVQGRGLGKRLLAALLDRAPATGCRSIVAVISGDQQVSIELHRKFGFVEAGRLTQAGTKLGGWLDVVFMQRMVAQ